MARRAAAIIGLALLPWLEPGASIAQPAPPVDTVSAVIDALEAVCRPSVEANVSPAVSATRHRYASVDTPPNLPTGRPLRAWQAPSPGPGKIYVFEGGLPQSAQAGCGLAVYGEALPTLPGAIQAKLAKDAAGFQANPTFSIAGPRQSVVRFDRRRGDVVTSVLVLQPKAVSADAPSALVAVSRVDYGWMTKFGG